MAIKEDDGNPTLRYSPVPCPCRQWDFSAAVSTLESEPLWAPTQTLGVEPPLMLRLWLGTIPMWSKRHFSPIHCCLWDLLLFHFTGEKLRPRGKWLAHTLSRKPRQQEPPGWTWRCYCPKSGKACPLEDTEHRWVCFSSNDGFVSQSSEAQRDCHHCWEAGGAGPWVPTSQLWASERSLLLARPKFTQDCLGLESESQTHRPRVVPTWPSSPPSIPPFLSLPFLHPSLPLSCLSSIALEYL